MSERRRKVGQFIGRNIPTCIGTLIFRWLGPHLDPKLLEDAMDEAKVPDADRPRVKRDVFGVAADD